MNDQLDGYLAAYGEGFGYAFDNNIMLNWYPDRIMRSCASSCRVLELGIGHGYTTDRFSRYFAEHVVVDGSASVIKQFRHQYPECAAKVIHAYFEDFMPEGSFDVIVLGFVLEHVADPAALLQRYRQFLRPGGRCFIAVPNGESLHRRFGHAAGLLDNMMTLGAGDRELGHRRLYSVASLSAEVEAAGMRVVRKEGIFLKPLTTAQLQSQQLQPEIIRAMCEVGIDYPELSAAILFETADGA